MSRLLGHSSKSTPNPLSLVLVVFLATACSSDPTPTISNPDPLTATPEPGSPILSSFTGPSCEDTNTDFLVMCWDEDLQIDVATIETSGTVRAQLEAAVDLWNQLLGQGTANPKFNWIAGDTANADVIIDIVSGSGPSYCGQEGNGWIYIYGLGSGPCHSTTSQYGSITTVAAHELATVLGWDDGVELYGVSGISDAYCLSTWPSPPPGPLSTQLCYHDVDGVSRLYRNSNIDLDPYTTYWGTKILAATDVGLALDSVLVGDSVLINGTSLGGGPYAQYGASVPYGGSQYVATYSLQGRLHQSGAYLVADDTGTVSVTLRPNSTPSGYSVFSIFEEKGIVKSIKVLPAPPDSTPDPPFSVVRIVPDTSPALPITVPGWYQFEAIVVSPPGTPVSVRWIVVDSRTPSVADTVWSYGYTTLSINIGAGSYTLSLTARPHYSLIEAASSYTQDVPVCTGDALTGGSVSLQGGMRGLATQELPPPENDAVGGCS